MKKTLFQLLTLFVVSLSLVACGDDDPEEPNSTPTPAAELELLSTTPTNNATGIPTGEIEVTFQFNQNIHFKSGQLSVDSFVDGATVKEIATGGASLYITVICYQPGTRITVNLPQGFVYSPSDMPNKAYTLTFTTEQGVQPQPGADFESSFDAVKNMGVGWNMGNTLEANRQTITDVSNDGYWGQQGLESEYCWGQFPTSASLLKMLKDAGFGAIRVPVTWYNHMDKNGNVDAAWMNRVRQVVDYVIAQGMYCIINVHHDTGADGEGFKSWLKADTAIYNSNKARYEYLWKQIAEEFRDYGQLLLFESYNEMLDKANSWCFASFATANQYDSKMATSAYNAINSYAQSFVDVVRATGGNNSNRNLVVNTYGACNGVGSWNAHLMEPLTNMLLPTDNVTGHLIFQVHAYPGLKNNNLGAIKSEVTTMISGLKRVLEAKGAPVIIGEWGTQDWDSDVNYANNRQNFLEFCTHLVQEAKANNIGTFYWMGITDGASRMFPAFSQPDLAKTILQAYYGTAFNPTLPVRSDYSNTCITATVTYNSAWGEFNLFTGEASSTDYSGIQVDLGAQPAAGFLQIKIYGSSDVTQTVVNASTTIKFTASMGKITRITLQGSNSGGSCVVKGIWLLHKDGAKTPLDPSVYWGCTMSDITLTNY